MHQYPTHSFHCLARLTPAALRAKFTPTQFEGTLTSVPLPTFTTLMTFQHQPALITKHVPVSLCAGPRAAGDGPHIQGSTGLHWGHPRHYQYLLQGAGGTSQRTQAAAIPALPTRYTTGKLPVHLTYHGSRGARGGSRTALWLSVLGCAKQFWLCSTRG